MKLAFSTNAFKKNTLAEAIDAIADIGYDGDRRIVRHRDLRTDNSLVVGFAYGYDRNSNKQFEEKLHSVANSELYGYDSPDRLVDFARGQLNATIDAIAGAPQKTRSWVLDGLGNWRLNIVNGTRTNAEALTFIMFV